MSTEAVTTTDAPAPVHLYCRTCWCEVELHDVPTHTVDASVFTCEPCRNPDANGQFSLSVDVRRVEHRTTYDPRDSRMPL